MALLRKILAIDDQLDNLTTIKAVLKSQLQNCTVITALSGKEGIEMARKEQPDTILLDIIMPLMDGYEVCKLLKEDDLTKHIPVVMITAIKTDMPSRVKALDFGADAFLSKPIDSIELIAQVKVMLRIKKAEDKLRADKEELEVLVSNRTIELNESQEKYRALYENAPLPYQSLNEDGRFRDVNPAWLETLGYQRDEVIGKFYKDFLHPNWVASFEKNFPAFKKRGYVNDVQFKIRHKDGSYFDISFEGCIGYNPDGSFKQTYCVFQDITEKKKAQEALLASQMMIEGIINTIPVRVFWKDKNLHYLGCNKIFANDAGLNDPSEIIGKDDFQLVWKEQATFYRTDDLGVIESGKPKLFIEESLTTSDGKLITLLTSKIPLRGPEGEIIGVIGTYIDISERKKEQEEILKLSKAVEQSPSVIVITNTSGAMEYVNPKFSELTGYNKQEVLGKKSSILKSGEQDPAMYKDLWETITSGKEWRGEFQNKKKNGELFWESANICPITDKNGITTSYIKVSKDITEQKRAKDIQKVLYNISNAVASTDNLKTLIALVQRELSTIIDTDNFFVALYDQHTGRIALPFFTDDFETKTHIPPGKTLTNYVIKTEKSLFATKAKVNELVEAGKVERHGADSAIWLGVPLKTQNRVTGVLAVQSYKNENAYNEKDMELLEFISDQISISIEGKRKEQIIKESEERYRSLVNNLPVGVFRSTPEGKVLSVNPAMVEIYGYDSVEDLLSVPAEHYYNHISDRQKMLKELDEKGFLLGFETQENKKDGSHIWVSINYKKTYNKKNQVYHIDGVVIDITEQKEAEEKLIDALHKAEESDRLKSAFLANMSHEIRTPMNGILGFAELLKGSDLTGEQQNEYLEIIEKSGARMLNIINDIVDISKIEAGMMKVFKNSTNINQQINDVFDFFKKEAEAKMLDIECKTGLPNNLAVIQTDSEKVYAILTNLVKNAIKYTDSGKITFGYELLNVTGNAMLQFYIKDTGIGIPENRIDAVFERFIQADIGDKRAFQGAGLGLAISKAYVEALGGEIWVESQEGKGSEFYFTIPFINDLEPEKDRLALEKDSPMLKNLKVLIAEDDEISEQLIRLAISPISKQIISTVSGVNAVEICKENSDIDLVIMDIKMPEMDGYEATKLIRQFNKNIIIIAQTAYALSGDREKAIAAGCNDYISKPIKSLELKALIEKHCGGVRIQSKLK